MKILNTGVTHRKWKIKLVLVGSFIPWSSFHSSRRCCICYWRRKVATNHQIQAANTMNYDYYCPGKSYTWCNSWEKCHGSNQQLYNWNFKSRSTRWNLYLALLLGSRTCLDRSGLRGNYYYCLTRWT